MENPVHERVLRILREQPSGALPLRELHSTLAAEAGIPVGSYAQFASEVTCRPDLFAVIEPRDPLGAVDTWPADLRAAYDEALRDAGLERAPRIALTRSTAVPGEDGLRAAERSLVELWIAAAGHPIERARLADAIVEIEAMRRALQHRT